MDLIMKSKCYFNFNPYLDLTYYSPVTQMASMEMWHLVHVKSFYNWTKKLGKLYKVSHIAKDKTCLIIKDISFLCLGDNAIKYPACVHGKFERREE